MTDWPNAMAGLVKLVRRISRVLALIWSIPVGLLMLWTCAVLSNGGPLWRHPAFVDWLEIELALVAVFVAADAWTRRLGRRSALTAEGSGGRQ